MKLACQQDHNVMNVCILSDALSIYAWNEQKAITWVWTKITTKFDHLQSIAQAKLKVLKPSVKSFFVLLLKVLKYKRYKQLWITMISRWSMDNMCSYSCSFFLAQWFTLFKLAY